MTSRRQPGTLPATTQCGALVAERPDQARGRCLVAEPPRRAMCLFQIPDSEVLSVTTADRERAIALTERSALAGEALVPIGMRPARDEVEYRAYPTSDWVIMPLQKDPSYALSGRLFAPEPVVRRVSRLDRAGVEFDGIWIAHELPKGAYDGRGPVPPELLLPPSCRMGTFSDGELIDTARLTKLWWRFLLGGLKSAGTATVGAIGAAAESLRAGRRTLGLDPMLFGVLRCSESDARTQGMAIWFYLAHWRWEAGEPNHSHPEPRHG